MQTKIVARQCRSRRALITLGCLLAAALCPHESARAGWPSYSIATTPEPTAPNPAPSGDAQLPHGVVQSNGKYYLDKGKGQYFEINCSGESPPCPGSGGFDDTAFREAKESFDDDYKSMQEEGRTLADEKAEEQGGECAMSEASGLINCKGTNTLVKGAAIMNQASQIAGSAAIQVMGQAAQAQASAEGTQSAVLRASAQTQKTSGTMQVTTGGANVLMGAMQLMKGGKHNSSAKQATSYAQSLCQPQYGTASYSACVSRAQAKIAAEQKGKAEEAMAGGAMSMITGVTQVTQGGFNIAAGKQLEAAADQLAAAEQTSQAAFQAMTPLDTGSGSEAQAAGQTSALTGSGEQSAALAEEAAVADAGTPTSLGDPFNTGTPDSNVGNAPTAGGFMSNSSGGGGGSLGMGGVGGGGTSPDSGGSGEGSSSPAIGRMATNSDRASLSGGGAIAKVGGGGGGGSGSSGDMDFSKMLAALLPKKDDDQNPASLMDYGGRGPAAEEPVSLLDRTVNIFDRVSKTYKEKASKGVVGE